MLETVGKIKQRLMVESKSYIPSEQNNFSAIMSLFRQLRVLQLPVINDNKAIGVLDLFVFLNCLKNNLNPFGHLFQDYDEAEIGTDILTIEDVKYDILVVNDSDGLYQGFIRRDTLDRLVIIRMMEERYLKALKAYKDLKEENDALLDCSYDGLYITDGQGTILKMNRSCERIEGIKAEEVIGRNLHDLVLSGVYSDSAVLRAIQMKKPVSLIQTTKHGRDILVSASPVIRDNHVLRVVVNSRDIGELDHLRRLLTVEEDSPSAPDVASGSETVEGLIFVSPAMKEITNLAVHVASVESTVLITGESGVGKEVLARVIHQNSKRSQKPFIKIDCSAIPETLLESELFGYEKGAFTGANTGGKVGLIELAHQGTLFLDEIGEIPLHLQVKLLRVLQDREILRLGGKKPINVDIRIIAATNRDLKVMVKEKEFREDLYYRLNVVPIYIPPLRDRRQDIKPLIEHFLNKFNERYGWQKVIADEALDYLINYDWPGNVRELENIIERMIVTTRNSVIQVADLPNDVVVKTLKPTVSSWAKNQSFKDIMNSYEREVLRNLLLKSNIQSVQELADILQIDASTVRRKLKKHGIQVNFI